MELALGVEPTDRYLAFEAAGAARKLVEEVMLVRPGENVLITVDTMGDRRVAELVAQAAYAARAVPTLVVYPASPAPVMEPPPPVAGAAARAQVWIELAVAYLLHTAAHRAALAGGCRYICLTGMDVDMLVRCIGRVDYPKMLALGEALQRIVARADEVRVTSPAGTDLVAHNRGRRVRHAGKLADTPGEPIMLGGQISWCPVESTIEGMLVFDGALWPPTELSRLASPVELEVHQGVIVAVRGGAEAQVFKRWLDSFADPNMYRIAHYSLGFNPGVTRPTGRIVEDERVFGCIEMGIGTQGAQIGGLTWQAASHTDGVVLCPSIYLDGEPLEVDGRYVHPEIMEACRSLGVPGY